jgi:menaquinol-cytochrome c reductase iron-sulfur subunit
MNEPDSPIACCCGRRGFFKKTFVVLSAGAAVLVPFCAAILALTDPLRAKGGVGEPVKITTLDAIPADGLPRKFPVHASRIDAWNKFQNVPIGAIYLRRTGAQVEALNVVCPHAGCFIDFSPAKRKFICPCHNSSFTMDGKIANPKSPSPRGMDALPVEVQPDGTVWVTFQNFRAGTRDKIPVT